MPLPNEIFSQLPSIRRDLTGLAFQSGEPFAVQRIGQEQAQNISQAVPNVSPDLGLAVMELLKAFQQGTVQPTAERAVVGGLQEQARRTAFTPPELIGASPAQQATARTAASEALEPTITGFADILRASKKLVQDIETQQAKSRDDARAVIRDAFTIGGADSLKNLDPSELDKLEKAAGYPKGYIQGVSQTLRERELELRRQQQQQTQESVDNWVSLLSSGQIGLAQVPIKLRNQIVNRAAELGIPIVSPEFAGKSKEAIAAFSSATALIDTLAKQALEVITAKSALGRIPQIARLGFGAFAQTIPTATTYKATRDAFLSMLTRAAGEKGVLTTQDVTRIKKALPDFNDTREVATRKIQNLRSLFESIKRGGIEAFTPGGLSAQSGTTPSGRKFRVIQ